jgi:hypothetical protein
MAQEMTRAAAPSKPAARSELPAEMAAERSALTLARPCDIPPRERRVLLLFHQMAFDEAARQMGYADMTDAVKDFALTELDDLARELGYENLLDFARQRNGA